MSFIQFLQPSSTRNLVSNPSVERNTTGWTAVGGSIARSDNWQFRGAYSLEVTPTSGTIDGVYFTTAALTAASYTFSVYGNFATGIPYQIRFADTSGVTVGSAVTFNGTGNVQRVTVTATASAAVHRLYIQKNSSASTAKFYVDAVQLEAGSTATTYADGDEPGCTWDGLWQLSTSTRSSRTTQGGVWRDLETDLGLVLTDMQGVGMPPFDVTATPYALLPGARYERSLARSRIMNLVMLAAGSSWQNLHDLRNALIARVQSDQTLDQQPVVMRYTGTSDPVTINAHYDSGLEFSDAQGFAESIGLRMVAHDPFWYSEKEDGVELTASGTALSIATMAIMSPDGTWADLDSSISGSIYVIVEDLDNTLLIGGSFTNAGGITGANNLVRYDPATNTWSAMGNFNGIVRTIYVAGRGNYLVGGEFSTIDGNSFVRIAEYTGGAWVNIGSANNTVRSIIKTDNFIVITGDFTTVSSVSAARIARRNAAGTWTAIGTGLSATGYALARDPAIVDAFYVAGTFITANSVTSNRIAYYNGSSFQALGSGLSTTAYALAITDDGVVYVGGAFITAGGLISSRVAAWTGTGWQVIPNGPTGDVPSLFIDQSGRLIVPCQNNGVNPGYIEALYDPNGSTNVGIYQGGAWTPTFHSHINSQDIEVAIYTRTGYFVVGKHFSVADALITYGTPQTVINDGSAPAQPIIVPAGYGVYNFTTGQGIYLGYQPGGNLLVDTRTGQQQIIIPDTGETRARYLISGSQLAKFVLLPGTNLVAAYYKGGTLGQTAMHWFRRNLSLDS